MVRDDHDSVVFHEGQRKQRLDPQIKPFKVDPKQVEVRLEADNVASFDRADELVRQLYLVPTYHVEVATEFTDCSLVPRDGQLRIESAPGVLAEVVLLNNVAIMVPLYLPLHEEINVGAQGYTTGGNSETICWVLRVYVDTGEVLSPGHLHPCLCREPIHLEIEDVTVGENLI